MAYTRIHAIKSTVEKAVAYICNPEKTEEKLLVDTFCCGIETVKYDFQFALSQTNHSDKNQAYHLIQSFAKGEVSHEEAHQIGIELADKLLKGKYSYIVATHTDKGHPHNHIIFAAADNVEHKKYNACQKSYYTIRRLSDELCKEHNLSIIIPSGKKGKKYVEWKAERESISWKNRLQNDIDDCIRIAKSYEEFLVLIRKKGYSVSGEKTGDAHAKYIKFLAPGQERFVRGSSRNFGAGYTKEEIMDRIENPDKWQNIVQNKTIQNDSTTNNPKPHIKVPKKDIIARTSANKSLIDTTGEKFQNSPGLQHWAKIKNLKTAAASYAAADNLSELQAKIAEKTAEANSARAQLVELEHEMKAVAELLHYAEQYRDNKPFHEKYKISKDPDRYLRMHETQLILYDGAERMLRKIGLTPENLNIKEIRKDYETLITQKTIAENNSKAYEKEVHDIQQKANNVAQYLSNNLSRSEKDSNIVLHYNSR